MADEITVTTGLRLSNGLLKVTEATTTAQFTQTTARGGGPGTVDVLTSETTIDFGDIVPGYCKLTNLDAANFCTYGTSTGELGFELEAGAAAIVKIASGESLIMQADTATVKVQITAFNR